MEYIVTLGQICLQYCSRTTCVAVNVFLCLKAAATPCSLTGSTRAAKGWAGKSCIVFQIMLLKSPSLLLRLDLVQTNSVLFFLCFFFFFLSFFFKSNLVNSNVCLSCQIHSLVIHDGFQSSWWRRVYKPFYFNCVTRGIPSLSWWHAFSFSSPSPSYACYGVTDLLNGTPA